MAYKIIKTVPIPPGLTAKKRSKYPFYEMAVAQPIDGNLVGDCFEIPKKEVHKVYHEAAAQRKKGENIRVTARVNGTNARIWRLS